MQTLYEHKQFGATMLILILIPALGVLTAVTLAGDPRVLPVLFVILAILLVTILIFSSLTVQVDAQQVCFFFGLGAYRRTFRVQRIQAVRIVRNPLWYGIGIHFIPGGVLYNVSGRDAVELTLEDGRIVRIGTDEPENLAEAIESARRLEAAR